jgi:predicted RecB family nuclease
MPRDAPYLTKSRYVQGLTCQKWLWLGWHDPAPYADPEPGTPAYVGIEVGKKAHLLFPGGVLVDSAPWQHAEAVQRTKELMANPAVPAIFEAALEYQGIRIRVDILERLPKGGWGIREVKSSSGVKDDYIHDLAVQVYVLSGCGLDLRSIELIHIDTSYVRGSGGIDWASFFARKDLSKAVKELLPEIPGQTAKLFGILARQTHPDIPPGKHCPDYCPFWERCTAGKPEDWVLTLPRITEGQLEKLAALGIESIRSIPDGFELNEKQARVRQVLKAGKPWLSPDLAKALRTFGPPADYLDFETVGPAIPLYEGTRPFQALPFQWSLHRLGADGNLTHDEFLAEGDSDPRRAFTESLIAALDGSNEPIIVYSAFEHRIIREMAALFPEQAKALDKIAKRLADLLPVVRSHVYFPEFDGSFSIKKVGPALTTNIDYGALDTIADGQAAQSAFERIASGNLGPGEDAASIRAALLKYCELDTLAMVEVHRSLRALAGG